VQNFSPISRVERMHNQVVEAEDIYEEVIRKAPRLNTKEGKALVSHSKFEQMNVFRIKGQVRKLRQEVRKAPWYKRSIPVFFKESLGPLEEVVHSYSDDAVNTSVAVSTMISDKSPESHAGEEILRRLTNTVETLSKQNASSLTAKDNFARLTKTFSLSTIGEES